MDGIVDRLLADPPNVHGDEAAGQERAIYALTTPALRLIADRVGPDDATLETGSGLSTIVFASTGARHTTVVPNRFEGERIIAYCAEHGISTDRVAFFFEPSERVLPGLDPDPLDLVLIDGSHSFPHTFIDWFYTAHRLRRDGLLLVDDVHLWTGRVLRDFMAGDPAWRLETEFLGRTSLFRKIRDTDPDVLWTDQPVVVRRSGLKTIARARQALSMLRFGQRDELVRMVRELAGR